MTFPCVPACIGCREAGTCSKPLSEKELPEREGTARNPYPRDMILLPCGCRDMPWPLFHKLGDNFDEIFCSAHGWQKLTDAYMKRAKKESRTMAAKEIIKKHRQDQLPDIPPY